MLDSSRSSIAEYRYNNSVWKASGSGYYKGWRYGYRMLEDGTLISSDGYSVKLYGDVRTIEGEDFPTDDEWEYELGEADGTKVT